jgi:hypothetical protein
LLLLLLFFFIVGSSAQRNRSAYVMIDLAIPNVNCDNKAARSAAHHHRQLGIRYMPLNEMQPQP